MESWEDTVRDYLRRPEHYWGRADHRQVRKLRRVFRRAERNLLITTQEYVDLVIEVARSRRAYSQRPIHLVNLGGSGSHWISRMLEQAGGAMDAGEVYLPPQWYGSLATAPQDSAASIIDAVEIAHALAVHPAPADLDRVRVINSAHGYDKPRFHTRARPESSLVHIVRDPRDRVLSVSLRKPEFRKEQATGLDDFAYLTSKARRSASAWTHFSSQNLVFDHTVRYEDMKADPEVHLGRLLDAIGIAVPPQLVRSVTRRNDAERLRSGAAPQRQRGNLDAGGVARGWHLADQSHQRTMHSLMAPAITGQGYPLGSCFPGEHLPSVPLSAPDSGDVLPAPPHVAVSCREREDAGWGDLAAAVPSRGRVRVRIEGPDVQAHELDDLRPVITDLCAAGHHWFTDEHLDALGALPALRGLDVAATSVTRRRTTADYPSLDVVNYSGLRVSSGNSRTSITEIVDY